MKLIQDQLDTILTESGPCWKLLFTNLDTQLNQHIQIQLNDDLWFKLADKDAKLTITL